MAHSLGRPSLSKLLAWTVLDYEGVGVSKPNNNSKSRLSEEQLLRIHKLHLGLYARVATELDVSPSYVSLVANGLRRSMPIQRLLAHEIAKIHASFK